jgi:hypothetical protein
MKLWEKYGSLCPLFNQGTCNHYHRLISNTMGQGVIKMNCIAVQQFTLTNLEYKTCNYRDA